MLAALNSWRVATLATSCSMLSRRDKLLARPWQERRYNDHRAKVASALPAIDARRPAARPHVAVKLKKWQRERERAAAVRRDNFALLQRLAALMSAHRLDNRWREPPPNFQNKVGQFYDEAALRARLEARAAAGGGGGGGERAASSVKCYACHRRKMAYAESAESRAGELPSIY